MSLPWRERQLFLGGALESLSESLRALPRGARCRVVVSNGFARYALVPFSSIVVGREANEALASHVFRATHGERVDGWEVRLARGGGLRLACALDASLVEDIRAAVRASGQRLTGIEPAFVAAYNAAHRRLPASCWFAVAEPGKLVLGLLLDGTWRHVAAERCAGDVDAALGRLLGREALLTEERQAAQGLPFWSVRYGADGVQAPVHQLGGSAAEAGTP